MEAPTASSFEEIDLRGVEPPSHILRMLKKASELPEGAGLRARLDNNPMQLYDLLQQRGFILDARRNADGTYVATVVQNRSTRTAH